LRAALFDFCRPDSPAGDTEISLSTPGETRVALCPNSIYFDDGTNGFTAGTNPPKKLEGRLWSGGIRFLRIVERFSR